MKMTFFNIKMLHNKYYENHQRIFQQSELMRKDSDSLIYQQLEPNAFKQVLQKDSRHPRYIKNYEWLISYLSLYKKSHIIRYKQVEKIYRPHLSLKILMEQGIPFNKQLGWYSKDTQKKDICVKQKYNFIVHVCIGLINLGELKIVQLDVNLSNIVKIGKNFYHIDFNYALFLALSNMFPRYRNYSQQSQLNKVGKILLENTKQILKNQILSPKTIFNQEKFSFLSNLENSNFITQDLSRQLKSNISVDQKVEKLISHLKTEISTIHTIQMGKMLSKLFSKQEMENIDSFRKEKMENILHRTKKNFRPLSQLVEMLKSMEDKSNLIMFYSEFTGYNYKSELEIFSKKFSQNQMMKNIYSKSDILYFKDLHEDKQKREVKYGSHNSNHWMTDSFQMLIQPKSKQLLQKLMKASDKNSSQFTFKTINLDQILNGFKINIQNTNSIIASEMNFPQTEGHSNDYNNYSVKYLDRLLQSQKQEKLTNIKNNYLVLQLNLFNYLETISSNYLIKPNHVALKQNKPCIYIYQPNITDQWNRQCHERKIQNIWKKGFAHVIKFIRDTCRGIIQLQKHGLFHPQINLENIFFCKQGQGLGSYKISNLEKVSYLHFSYKLDNLVYLINSTKMVFHYMVNQQNFLKQELPKLHQILEKTTSFFRQFLDQLPTNNNYGKNKHIICSQNYAQATKNKYFFDFLRQSYKKMNSMQLGKLLQELFEFYTQSNGSYINKEVFIPKYWLNNVKQLRKKIDGLYRREHSSLVEVEQFLIQFNHIFPNCDVSGHEDNLVHYYYYQAKTKQENNLCNTCIEKYYSKQQSIQLLCRDHNKPIIYFETNKKMFKYFDKRYYCEDCRKDLANDNQIRLIDSTDLNQCKYVCLDISCKSNFISEKNKVQNHSNHSTFTLKQFQNIYTSFDTSNSAALVHDCKQRSTGNLSHMLKIVYMHKEWIQTIFLELTKFKGESDYCENKIRSILYPHNFQPSLYQQRNNLKNGAQESQNSLFWKIAKIMYKIHQRKEEHKFLSIEGLVEYANDTYNQLAQVTYQNINKQLQILKTKIQQKYFSPTIDEDIKNHLTKKYNIVINNEKTDQIQPCHFDFINQKYNQLIEELSIQRTQMDLKEYFKERVKEKNVFDKFCTEKKIVYEKWINKINEQEFNTNNNSKRNIFSMYYDTFHDQMKSSISKQITTIAEKIQSLQEDKTSLSNRKALEDRITILEMQKQVITLIYSQLKQNSILKVNNLNSNISKWKDQQNKIAKELAKLSQSMEVDFQSFWIRFKNHPQALKQDEIKKLYRLKNLREFTFILSRGYGNRNLQKVRENQFILTSSMLKSVLQNCPKLQRIFIKGGIIQYFSCIQLLISQKYRNRNIQFYVNSQNILKYKEDFVKLDKALQYLRIPCVRIRLRKNIDAEEKEIIMRIISKVNEINLEVEGPLMKNRFILQILQYIAAHPKVTVTSLLLKKFKIAKNNDILTALAKKGQIQKIQLLNCLEHSSQFISHCPQLKQIEVNSSTYVLIDPFFMKSIFDCVQLESIVLANVKFNPKGQSLEKIYNLKNLVLRYCKEVNDDFIASINNRSRKTIESVLLTCCKQLTNDALLTIEKFISLKAFGLNQLNIHPHNLLRFQANDLEMLEFNLISDVNDQLLEKIAKKWSKISFLGIRKCLDVTFRGLSNNPFLKNLTNLHINVGKFKLQQKYELMQNRKIHIEEYN